MASEKEIRTKLGFKEDIKYHYCSLESLLGIVTSRSIWLTCFESTNDKKELRTGQKILNDLLREMVQDEQDEELKEIFQKILLATADKEYKKHRTNYHYYGASFVERKDSLTHWERYGSNGYGVCIAFNMWMIEHFFLTFTLSNIFFDTWLWHSRVIYDEKLQKNYLKDMILGMIEGFKTRLGLNSNANILIQPGVCNTIYYSILSRVKPRFKHLGFSDESEYRLVFAAGEAEGMYDYFHMIAPATNSKNTFLNVSKKIKDAVGSLNLNQSNKQYRIIGSSIRSYYSMNLARMWGDALISEIILGPRCYQNKKELLTFLKANGLDRTKVKVSEIPIR